MTGSSFAANYYVRPNGGSYGAKNGSDWNNAFDGFSSIPWSRIAPGDTIWVAGGTYTQNLSPAASGSAGKPIAIRRARADASACTSAAGWNSAFNSTVVMQRAGIFFNGNRDYITISGRTSENGGNRGWHLNFKGATRGPGMEITNSSDADFITVEYMDLEGPGAVTYTSNGRAIDFTSFSDASDVVVSNVRIFDWESAIYLAGIKRVTIEQIDMYDISPANWQDYHPNGIYNNGTTDVIVRHSKFHKGPKGHGVGEGIFFQKQGGSANWQIYGNVFYDLTQSGWKALNISSSVPNLKLWNNTFVNNLSSLYTKVSAASGSELKNNLFYSAGSGYRWGTTSNNLFASSANVFVNSGAKDFRIVSNTGSSYPRNAGTALATDGYINKDMDGNIRGADGQWDIGAYEYSSGNNPPQDTTAPTVSVTAPASGAVVKGSVNLSASASDNSGGSGVASVTFLIDGTEVGTDTTAPYTATWDSTRATDGSHTLQVRATDVAGNVKESSTVTFTVQNTVPDTTAPTVSVTAPSAGATVSGSVSLSASASDNSGGSGVASVAFLIDGTVVSTDSSAPYAATWDSTRATNGSHTVRARATDVAGNVRESAAVTFTVQNGTSGGGDGGGNDGGGNDGGGSNDTTAPTVSLTGLTAGSTVTGSVELSASAADTGSGVASVAFQVDGNTVGTSTAQPYKFTWDTRSASNGTHAVRAVARDVAGNEAVSNTINVNVANTGGVQHGGLIGYWSMNETSGTTVSDSSPSGNVGTVVGQPKWAAGKLAGGLSFDGGQGYVRVPSTSALEQVTNAVTVSAWVKLSPNGPHGTMQTILRKVMSETQNVFPYTAYDLVIQDFNGQFKARMAVTRADGTRGQAWGQLHNYGEWFHFVGVYDGSNVRIYVNGVEENSTAVTGTLVQTKQPLVIGRYGTVGETANGLIDDVRLYNRGLSVAEVQALYNAKQPVPPTGLKQASN